MEQQSCQQQHSQHLQSFPALFLPARDPPFLSPFLESSSDGGWSVIRATSFFSPPDSFMCCMDTIHMLSVHNTYGCLQAIHARTQHIWLTGYSTCGCQGKVPMIVITHFRWLSGYRTYQLLRHNTHDCQETMHMSVRTLNILWLSEHNIYGCLNTEHMWLSVHNSCGS